MIEVIDNAKFLIMQSISGLILLLTLFVHLEVIQAQENYTHRHFRILELRGFSGNYLHTGELLREALESGYWAINVRYGWQSANPQGWQSKYLYPAYGLGWYNGFLGNPDVVGSPGAFFGFISFPLFNHPRHQMVIEPAFGLSYDFEPFHHETNHMNDAIGSRFNLFFNLNTGAKYRLNREMDMVYGFDLTHFSNGRTFRPNTGINLTGFNLGIRYHFNTRQNRVDGSAHPDIILPARPELEIFKRSQSVRQGFISIFGAGSVVQNPEDMGTSIQYGTSTGMLEYQYVLNTKNAFTAGLNYFYDGSRIPTHEVKNHFLGFHTGYDFRFWDMSIRTQVGTYLTKEGRQAKGNFFLRPALRYDFARNFYVQLGLKTLAGPRADWLEPGIGTKIRIF
jgi:hypothetical protein